MRFEGIQRTCRSVRHAAVSHGWVVVSETRAGTDSRYLEVARGSQWLKIRISDHPPTRDCDLNVAPSGESLDEVVGVLSARPVFSDGGEAETWLRAMQARQLWAEYERARQADEENAGELQRRAEALAPRHAYLVARGDGRLHPVDLNWLECLSQDLR